MPQIIRWVDDTGHDYVQVTRVHHTLLNSDENGIHTLIEAKTTDDFMETGTK